MSDYETTLRELAEMTIERAACLAGAEALRLVREYREAIAEALPLLERGRTHGYAAGWNRADEILRRALLTETPR